MAISTSIIKIHGQGEPLAPLPWFEDELCALETRSERRIIEGGETGKIIPQLLVESYANSIIQVGE